MGEPHKYAEFIKAKADGETIQEMNPNRAIGKWTDMADDDWEFAETRKYRIKPAPPKYPQTKMTKEEVAKIWNSAKVQIGSYEPLYDIANAAIARAIEDKQVFTADSVKQALEAGVGCEMVPAAMLEKVAEAVRSELVTQVARYSTGCSTYINGEIDLASIVKRVKEGRP